MLKWSYRHGIAIIILFMLSTASHAADDKNKEQARRLQQKVSVLEQEKSQLIQEKSQLEQQLKEKLEQLGQARRGTEVASRKTVSLDKALKQAEDEKAELASKLANSEQKLAEAEKTLTSTAETLHQTETSKTKTEADLAQRNSEYSGCLAKNDSLHKLGLTLLNKYQEKSCLTSVLEKEPLTRIKGAKLEIMLDEYREKLDAERLEQQQTAQFKLAAQKREEEFAALHRLQQQHEADQAKREQEQSERMKARQQSDLDRISRKVKEFFSDSSFSEGLF